MRKTINVNRLANFEFWVGMFKPRTKFWQRKHLRGLRAGLNKLETEDERADKIKALEFLLKGINHV